MINKVKYIHSDTCNKNCNKKGICLNDVCICQQGFTSEDCSLTIKEFKNDGYKLEDMFIFLIVILVLGMIFKLVIFIMEKSSKKYHDHLNLE